MKETIWIQDRLVSYELTRKPVKNINIRVRADGSVGVSADARVPKEEIEKVLQQKATFLLNALDRFAAQPRPVAQQDYAAGSVVFLLGRAYQVSLLEGTRNEVRPEKENLLLTVTDPDTPPLRIQTMEMFLKETCLSVTRSLCQRWQPKMAHLGVPVPEIRVRSMVSRWGSCKPSARRITFARQLVAAPLACVEYVVCHELVHFLHPNHAKAFYDCLSSFLPDWNTRRQRLNSPGDW